MRIHESHKMGLMLTGEDMCLGCEAIALIQLVRPCWPVASFFANNQVIEQVALRTGLTEQICQDLLARGWVYIETIDCQPRWEKGLHAT
jgi:hypothetical protein